MEGMEWEMILKVYIKILAYLLIDDGICKRYTLKSASHLKEQFARSLELLSNTDKRYANTQT